jgi:hypothetical protein
VKFIIMQGSPRPVFLPFTSKYLPQHCSQKPSVYIPPPKTRDQVSHPCSTTGKITILYLLIFRFF